jgi:hypothetical protein
VLGFLVNTDDLILDICNNLPGVNLTINDIGRSHVIGRAKSGKCQVIVRFLSYRVSPGYDRLDQSLNDRFSFGTRMLRAPS